MIPTTAPMGAPETGIEAPVFVCPMCGGKGPYNRIVTATVKGTNSQLLCITCGFCNYSWLEQTKMDKERVESMKRVLKEVFAAKEAEAILGRKPEPPKERQLSFADLYPGLFPKVDTPAPPVQPEAEDCEHCDNMDCLKNPKRSTDIQTKFTFRDDIPF